MRIAVTGASGFIGSYVVAEAIRRKYCVRALSRRPASFVAQQYYEAVKVDLQEPGSLANALRGCDVVVHCAAAMAGDRASQEAVTVGGTRNLLRAMAEAGVARMIGISTFAVYDYVGMDDGTLLDETAPLELRPETRAPYIGAKQRQEELIRAAPAAWTILRPGLVFGPGRTWFYHLGLRLPSNVWLRFAPASLLPLTYVENCAEAIVLAAESDAARSTILNVVDDELPDRRQYTTALARSRGTRLRKIDVPWPLLRGMAAVATGANHTALGGRLPLPDMFQSQSLHARCKPLTYSNERLKQVLQWEPRVHWRSALESAARAEIQSVSP